MAVSTDYWDDDLFFLPTTPVPTTEQTEDNQFGYIYRIFAYATWIAFWVIILAAIMILLHYCCVKLNMCCYNSRCRRCMRKTVRPCYSNQRCNRIFHLSCLDSLMNPSSTDATPDDLSEIFRISSPPDYTTALGMPKPERPTPTQDDTTNNNSGDGTLTEVTVTSSREQVALPQELVTSSREPATSPLDPVSAHGVDPVTDSNDVVVVEVDVEAGSGHGEGNNRTNSSLNPLYEFDNAAFIIETNDDNDGLPSYDLALEILERTKHTNHSPTSI